MGCPHLCDSPISYPAPHKAEVRPVATQACWLKKPTRFSFLKSPQVSIAAIAALQLEPRRAIVPSFGDATLGRVRDWLGINLEVPASSNATLHMPLATGWHFGVIRSVVTNLRVTGSRSYALFVNAKFAAARHG